MCRKTVPEVLSQKDASQSGVLEPIFPSIHITNTSSSLTEFWVTSNPEPIFFRKVALVNGNTGGGQSVALKCGFA
jgi:hypothetical protein